MNLKSFVKILLDYDINQDQSNFELLNIYKREIKRETLSAFELSSPLVRKNPELFNRSPSFVSFLFELCNIQINSGDACSKMEELPNPKLEVGGEIQTRTSEINILNKSSQELEQASVLNKNTLAYDIQELEKKKTSLTDYIQNNLELSKNKLLKDIESLEQSEKLDIAVFQNKIKLLQNQKTEILNENAQLKTQLQNLFDEIKVWSDTYFRIPPTFSIHKFLLTLSNFLFLLKLEFKQKSYTVENQFLSDIFSQVLHYDDKNSKALENPKTRKIIPTADVDKIEQLELRLKDFKEKFKQCDEKLKQSESYLIQICSLLNPDTIYDYTLCFDEISNLEKNIKELKSILNAFDSSLNLQTLADVIQSVVGIWYKKPSLAIMDSTTSDQYNTEFENQKDELLKNNEILKMKLSEMETTNKLTQIEKSLEKSENLNKTLRQQLLKFNTDTNTADLSEQTTQLKSELEKQSEESADKNQYCLQQNANLKDKMMDLRETLKREEESSHHPNILKLIQLKAALSNEKNKNKILSKRLVTQTQLYNRKLFFKRNKLKRLNAKTKELNPQFFKKLDQIYQTTNLNLKLLFLAFYKYYFGQFLRQRNSQQDVNLELKTLLQTLKHKHVNEFTSVLSDYVCFQIDYEKSIENDSLSDELIQIHDMNNLLKVIYEKTKAFVSELTTNEDIFFMELSKRLADFGTLPNDHVKSWKNIYIILLTLKSIFNSNGLESITLRIQNLAIALQNAYSSIKLKKTGFEKESILKEFIQSYTTEE